MKKHGIEDNAFHKSLYPCMEACETLHLVPEDVLQRALGRRLNFSMSICPELCVQGP